MNPAYYSGMNDKLNMKPEEEEYPSLCEGWEKTTYGRDMGGTIKQILDKPDMGGTIKRDNGGFIDFWARVQYIDKMHVILDQ